jgi:ribosomal-protein-alanine N-acetyltransferase
LLEHAMKATRQQNARALYLEVRPSNTPAIRMYEKMGFEAFALRKAYYPTQEGREDALVMRIML